MARKVKQPPLIVIVGPTASGKSDLAIQVAKEFDGEIICADSRTVYKGMDIGTAKPTEEDRAAVPHHLLDVIEPSEPFTAAVFKELANKTIVDIANRGKLPIMVGGTGLYIDAVIFDYQFGEPANPQVRAHLQQMSIEELQQECRNKNIEMPTNHMNKRHLVRAIELGGLPKKTSVIRENTLVVGIATEKEVLIQRVTKRAHAMLTAGILSETAKLGERYGWGAEALTGNIYRIFREVLQGTLTQEDAIDAVVRSDLQLAKRQATWFKRNPHIIWGTPKPLLEHIKSFVAVVKR